MKNIVTLIAFFALGLLAAFTTRNNTPAGGGYEIGDVATDFSLKSATTGNMVSLADYENANGWIVIFTCNHCPYAKMWEDRIIELHEDYAPLGYPVVAINPNDPEVQPEDSFEKMQERASEKSFPFEYLFDEDQEIYPQYGATRTPHVFLLNQDRVVKYIGAIDDNVRDADAVQKFYLRDAIEALQNGEDPDPGITKAVGCTIKAK